MSATYSHGFDIHGCRVDHNFQNTAARVTFGDDATEDKEFVSEAAKGDRPQAEPTATLQAIHAAKAWKATETERAAEAEKNAVAAAVQKAKAKADAANLPKPTKAK